MYGLIVTDSKKLILVVTINVIDIIDRFNIGYPDINSVWLIAAIVDMTNNIMCQRMNKHLKTPVGMDCS